MQSSRRNFINNTAIGVFGLFSLKDNLTTSNPGPQVFIATNNDVVHSHYPSTDPQDIKNVVGAAHSDLEEVKRLVSARPELAKATYDWGFGDVESALGAAAHMGRKDIAEFLISQGARPNIFTYAMLGKIDAVRAMIEAIPGIQKIKGPHGLTLLHHARIRLRRENIDGIEKEQQEDLVNYLISLNDADIRDKALDITAEEQDQYYGIYQFGTGDDEYFEVKKNSRGRLFLSRGAHTGRILNKVGNHVFAPGGAPSVKIIFGFEGEKVISLSIHDPDPILIALKK